MKNIARIAIPIFILLIAAAAYGVMDHFAKKPVPKPREKKLLPVEIVHAKKKSVRLSVKTYGTVTPRTRTVLMPEVAGKIISVSSQFYPGGFFKKGDILLAIEQADYKAAAARARADLASAKLRLEQEKALAEQAKKDWRELGRGKPSNLVLRKPQLNEAVANLNYAKAVLEKAQRDLERTELRAPYPGMVFEKNADIGQYVAPGTSLATIFAIDYAQIRLPITANDMAWLDLPDTCYKRETKKMANVLLHADLAGKKRTWKGRIVRTEGAFDPSSRVMYVVAQVADPYGLNHRSDNGEKWMPLRVGLFVEAEIAGIMAKDAVVLPAHAVRGTGSILVVDNENRLQTRKIDILKADEKNVIVQNGIEPDERVCITALEFMADGMEVKPVNPVMPSEKEPDDKKGIIREKTDEIGGRS